VHTHEAKKILTLLLLFMFITAPSYAAISMTEPPANAETPEGQSLKILCSFESQEPAEYVYIYLEEDSSGKWERITQDNVILPVESTVFCGSLNPKDACSAQWNVVPSQQTQVNLRCKSVYYWGQNIEEVTAPVIIKIGARLESNTIQIPDEDKQKLLDELKSTKSALENLLRSGSYPLGSAKDISDALTTTNAVIDSLESGTISKDEAESTSDNVKSFLASITGKISGKAAEVQPDKKTSGVQNTTIMILAAAIGLTAVAIRHKRHIKLEKASGLEKTGYKPESKNNGKYARLLQRMRVKKSSNSVQDVKLEKNARNMSIQGFISSLQKKNSHETSEGKTTIYDFQLRPKNSRIMPMFSSQSKKIEDIAKSKSVAEELPVKKTEGELSVLDQSKNLIQRHKTASLRFVKYNAKKQKIRVLRNEMNKNYCDFKSGKKDIVDYETERERLSCEIAGAKHEAKTIRDEQQCR